MALKVRWGRQTIFPSAFHTDNVFIENAPPFVRGTRHDQNRKPLRINVIDRNHDNRSRFVTSNFFAEDGIQEDEEELASLDWHAFGSLRVSIRCWGGLPQPVPSITRRLHQALRLTPVLSARTR
jgi:hypothetical protein